jgi:hypothetical protein
MTPLRLIFTWTRAFLIRLYVLFVMEVVTWCVHILRGDCPARTARGLPRRPRNLVDFGDRISSFRFFICDRAIKFCPCRKSLPLL